MNESMTIMVKLASGWEQEFNTLAELFQWLAHFELEPCENGWTELNEYCERRVAYAVDDEPEAPSCEMLVQHHQPGVAHAYIKAEENV